VPQANGANSAAGVAVRRIEAALRARADAVAAVAMRRYMRDQFPFLGIPTPGRRRAQREALAGVRLADEAALLGAATALWTLPEREFQYAAVDLLASGVRRLSPGALPAIERLITTKSWWDTVDGLAGSVAGRIVLAHPGAETVMDHWIDDEDMWLRRSALLHQLKWKERTDEQRLFRYCLARAAEKEFFIRKAIGWALRQYSWTNGEAVRQFVQEHEAELSGLSRREALLALNGGRSARAAR
jgi:3-methyladenine DNA glycosylase AlkD